MRKSAPLVISVGAAALVAASSLNATPASATIARYYIEEGNSVFEGNTCAVFSTRFGRSGWSIVTSPVKGHMSEIGINSYTVYKKGPTWSGRGATVSGNPGTRMIRLFWKDGRTNRVDNFRKVSKSTYKSRCARLPY